LLIDATHALQGADVEDVLRTQVAGVSRVDFPAREIVFALSFQDSDLGFGQYQTSLGGLPFQLLGFDRASQPLSKRVTLPFATKQCQIRSELLHLIIPATNYYHFFAPIKRSLSASFLVSGDVGN